MGHDDSARPGRKLEWHNRRPPQAYVHLPLGEILQVQHRLASDVRAILTRFADLMRRSLTPSNVANTRTFHEAHNMGLPPTPRS